MQAWPATLTRVPYWVYQDAEVLAGEQQKIFEGPVWNFLCLEMEIPKNGDWRSTHVGAMPVVVARDTDGAIRAFENRCAHRGALICIEDSGNVERTFHCVYHAWRYDLKGNLIGIAFKDGVNGKGGMNKDFRMEAHGPRKLRTATLCGLVFGTLSPDMPPVEKYLGEEILGRMKRVLKKPVRILGKFTQALPNNWKLYIENVKDTYHASLLHTFFATFRITRLSQGGGVTVTGSGAHHVSTTRTPPAAQVQDAAFDKESVPTNKEDSYRLADPSLLHSVDEFGDGIQLQILSVFPGFVLQQIHNCLAVRQVLPKGVEATELNWTYIGFEDDTPELRRMRLKQANLVGPAGFVSMEDGAVGGFVQRGTAAAASQQSIVEMGGALAESQDTRATEASVRGFWKTWRACMGV
ncbi:MAG: Rieske (2Fe-2S) protein [Betaproteobacteria bacterium]|nr:Rieske (2Fe-2S) protein [Betaproteobacteria bacterium]